MYFRYIAAQSNGKIVEGDVEAQGPAEVLENLAAQGLRPISLKVIKGVAELGKAGIFGQKISVTDKVFLTKYLALMLQVGTDLFRAIDILIADFDKTSVKALLIEIRNTLSKGQPFYITFAKYPKYFSAVFVNLIKAGEASGNLQQIFEELSVSLQEEQELRQKIKSALAYPLILLGLAFLMLIFLVTFALPKIANIFLASNVQPPLFSRIVFGVGLFLNQYIFYLLAFFIVFGLVFWYFFFKTLYGRRIMYRAVTKLPIIKNIVKHIAFERFASTLAALLKAGLPILDALEITADAVGYDEIKQGLLRISREGIAKGLSIGDAFRRESAFPRVIVNLMAISEKSGHLDQILKTLSSFYESEIETSIKILISFLEPALLLAIGLVIGTIALSIIVPVYQLIAKF